eukprot:14644588-Alexandrium_andersonii.AAC.1
MPARSDCLLCLYDLGDLAGRAVLPRPVLDVGHVLPWPGRSALALSGMGARRRRTRGLASSR